MKIDMSHFGRTIDELDSETEKAYANNITKPNHYIGIQGLEVEEVTQNFLPRYTDGYVSHRIGSAIEYLLRAPLKNGIEDIKKAKENLEQIIEYEEFKPIEIEGNKNEALESVRNALEEKIKMVPKVNLIEISNATADENKKQNDTFGSFMRDLSEISRKEAESKRRIATHYAGTNPLD